MFLFGLLIWITTQIFFQTMWLNSWILILIWFYWNNLCPAWIVGLWAHSRSDFKLEVTFSKLMNKTEDSTASGENLRAQEGLNPAAASFSTCKSSVTAWFDPCLFNTRLKTHSRCSGFVLGFMIKQNETKSSNLPLGAGDLLQSAVMDCTEVEKTRRSSLLEQDDTHDSSRVFLLCGFDKYDPVTYNKADMSGDKKIKKTLAGSQTLFRTVRYTKVFPVITRNLSAIDEQ